MSPTWGRGGASGGWGAAGRQRPARFQAPPPPPLRPARVPPRQLCSDGLHTPPGQPGSLQIPPPLRGRGLATRLHVRSAPELSWTEASRSLPQLSPRPHPHGPSATVCVGGRDVGLQKIWPETPPQGLPSPSPSPQGHSRHWRSRRRFYCCSGKTPPISTLILMSWGEASPAGLGLPAAPKTRAWTCDLSEAGALAFWLLPASLSGLSMLWAGLATWFFLWSRLPRATWLPVSVGLGDVAVHVEVPGDLWQREFGSFQLRSQHDLAAQPGVLLKKGGHVQHVVLPGARRRAVMGGAHCPAGAGPHRAGRREAGAAGGPRDSGEGWPPRSPLIGRRQKVQVVLAHVHVAGRAGQGSFTGPCGGQMRCQ